MRYHARAGSRNRQRDCRRSSSDHIVGRYSLRQEGRPVFPTLARGARLRCPACGARSVFQSPFRVRPFCPACGTIFQREEGFFLGAIMLNVVTTEAVVIAAAGLYLLLFPSIDEPLLPFLFAVAL